MPNNLEGGQGGTWQVKWVDKPFDPEIKNYNEEYYAFDASFTLDQESVILKMLDMLDYLALKRIQCD